MMLKRSFVRLVARGVVVCWVIGLITVVLYARKQTWIAERARSDGIFLAYDLLREAPIEARPALLERLRTNLPVPLSFMTRAAVEARLQRPITPGEQIPLRVDHHEEWYFLALPDEPRVLAAGPVNPSLPPNLIPIGLIVGILALPFLGGVLAFRLERELSKVERASQALAVGDLGARVDNPSGPSNELAASFNAMAERIQRLIRDRDELVQAVSHELGHPLSRLRFQLELLSANPQQTPERTAAMGAELDALDALVAELLTYVQSETHTLDKERFDPRQDLSDLVELTVLDRPDEPLLTATVQQPEGAFVLADRRQFHRAIENLLRNAARHAQATVQVDVTPRAQAIEIAIHDDGPGIPEAMRLQVTQPFVRLDKHRGRESGGVGLGLAIVHRICQRHGGQLRIDTSPLGGACVVTVWPT